MINRATTPCAKGSPRGEDETGTDAMPLISCSQATMFMLDTLLPHSFNKRVATLRLDSQRVQQKLPFSMKNGFTENKTFFKLNIFRTIVHLHELLRTPEEEH